MSELERKLQDVIDVKMQVVVKDLIAKHKKTLMGDSSSDDSAY